MQSMHEVRDVSLLGQGGSMTRPRICIIGLDDYGLLTGERTTKYVGGETVQHVLLARAWRRLGLDVSIVVSDHGQPKVEVVDGISAIAAHAKGAGLPGIRFLHPHSTSIVRAMHVAAADIYYQSLAGFNTGLTAWFCRRHDKRFVFRISSDAYCVPGKQLTRLYRDRKAYEYGVRRADLIIAQTEHQRQLLRAGFKLESELANLVAEPPASGAPAKDIDVLWVANFRAVKQPDLVIDLARRLPHLQFVVVGGGQEQYARRMRQAEQELSNLAVAGPVAYDAVGAYFDRSRIFLNTSSLEGFPNTFLQAWMRGVPVVSFFDPDGLIARERLGCKVADLDAMTAALGGLAADSSRRNEMGERASRFAADNFSADAVAKRYLELFATHFGKLVPRLGRLSHEEPRTA
jgi:glycosyltransferase involved in cell wall biosynthesis